MVFEVLRARGIVCSPSASRVSSCNTAGPRRKGVCFLQCTQLRLQHSTTIPIFLRASHVWLLGPAATPAAHARNPFRHLADCRGWAGLLDARGTVPPSDRSPRLLFGPLTSNEERAGREGRGCGGAGTARRARGRGRRGHVTAALASTRGGGALPGSRSPPERAAAPKQLPARKQQLRAHPHQLAPVSRTCDLLLRSSPPPPPA